MSNADVNPPAMLPGFAGICSPSEFDQRGEESRRLCTYWREQLDAVKDEYRKFDKRGRTIEKRYRDERSRVDEEGQRRYASLWSNVQTLLPALYGRAPTPIVERRFRDKDPVGRGAAQILERGLRNEVEICGFEEAVGQAVLDYLLPGRGQVWVRYEPEMEEGVSVPTDSEMELRDARGVIEPDDDTDTETEVKLTNTGDRVVRESVPVDYVPWSDFFVFPARARTWKEVVAVGKRVYMTRDQMCRRFGREVGRDVPLEKDGRERRRQSESQSPISEPETKAEVYEIWSRADERVYWLAEGYTLLLDRRDDPLELENFFPCPRPLQANATNNTLVPVADYMQYQDQAIQIDELTQRIAMLCKACKVAGVYNAAAKDIQRLLDESVENELIPVDAWAAFAEKGGVAGQIALLPLQEIIGVINELDGQLDKTIAKMDRLTGITDIMRGTGDARETLGGQRLKTNAGGTRTSTRQNEVARFCRDVVRLMGDVMCRHFSAQSLVEASGALYEEGLGGKEALADMLETLGGVTATGAAPSAGPLAPPTPQPPVPGAPTPLGAPAGGQGMPQPGMPQPSGPQSGQVVPFPGRPPGYGPQPQQQPQVPPELEEKLKALKRIASSLELLRNERLRGFRVDIEVDSTIYGDAQQEKADRVEFIGAVTKFLETGATIGAQVPEMVPLLGKLLQFGVRGFRVGRDLESTIEDFCDQAEEAAKARAAGGEQKTDPKLEAEKLKGQTALMLAQSAQQTAQLKAQTDAQNLQQKTQADAMKSQVDAQNQQQKMQADVLKAQTDQQNLAQKLESDRTQAAAEVARQRLEGESEAFNAQMDHQTKQLDYEIEQVKLKIELAKLEGLRAKAKAPKTEAAGAA